MYRGSLSFRHLEQCITRKVSSAWFCLPRSLHVAHGLMPAEKSGGPLSKLYKMLRQDAQGLRFRVQGLGLGVSKEDSQASPKHSKAWVFGFRFREFDLELKGSYEGFRIACVCVWVVVNSHMHICIYTHACMHTYIHAYICIYAYVTMHVYIYVHIQVCLLMQALRQDPKSSSSSRVHYENCWALGLRLRFRISASGVSSLRFRVGAQAFRLGPKVPNFGHRVQNLA